MVIPILHHGQRQDGVVGPGDLIETLCIGSENTAGDCEAQAGKEPMNWRDGVLVTVLWSTPEFSWREKYVDHMQSVAAASPAFVCHREEDTRSIFPGKKAVIP